MAALEAEKPLATSFDPSFVCTDQDVADLKAGAPRPETRWCLVELPKEELAALEKGTKFYFHEFSGTSRGEDGGRGALCSETATYALEFLENSNSLMIGAITLGIRPDAGGETAASNDEVGASEDAQAPVPDKKNEAPEGKEAAVPDNRNAAPAGPEASTAPASDKDKAPATESGSGVTTFGTCHVFAQCRGQLITKPAHPDVNRLRSLLAQQTLGGPTNASGHAQAPEGIKMESLEFQVAASPSQLRNNLKDGPFVEYGGCWRLLPSDVEIEIVDTSLSLVAALGWNLEAVDGESLLREVHQHFGPERSKASVPSLPVLTKALRSVLKDDEPTPSETKKDSASDSTLAAATAAAASQEAAAAVGAGAGGGRLLRFDKQKVDRSRALLLLQDLPARVRERFQLPPPGPRAKRARVGASARGGAGDALKVEEFAKAFQELSGTEASTEDVLKMLGDCVGVDELEGTVSPLDTGVLSRDPFERLGQLFALQTHWRAERLAQLIAPTLGAGQKVDTWLLKWARPVFVQLGEPPAERRLMVKKFAGL